MHDGISAEAGTVGAEPAGKILRERAAAGRTDDEHGAAGQLPRFIGGPFERPDGEDDAN